VNVIDELAVAVGVPDSNPLELNVIPDGRDPVLLQVIGDVPDALNCVFVYAVFAVPTGKEVGEVMTGAEPPVAGYQLPLPMSTLSVIRLSS
jgi:hypothetical protein